MITAPLADVRARLSAYLDRCEAEGPIVITRNGRPVAVILGVEDEDDLERLLMVHSPRLQAILERSRQQIRDGKGLSPDEFWAAVEARQRAKGRGTARTKKS
jgi:prevent-host-death family protein